MNWADYFAPYWPIYNASMTPYNTQGVFVLGNEYNNYRRVLVRNPWWGSTWDSMVASAGTPPGPPAMYEYCMLYQYGNYTGGFGSYLYFQGGQNWYDGQYYLTNSSHFVLSSQYGL